MKRREQFLAIITVVALIGAVAYRMMPTGGGLSALTSGDLDSSRTTFQEFHRLLEDGPEIRERFERVAARFPERHPNRTPRATFTDELTALLKEKGWPNPTLSPAREIEIDDVDDFYYIDLDVQVAGPFAKMINLLITFQQTGLLIKSFDFQIQRIDLDRDRDMVQMDVTVSRLAKWDEDEKPSNSRRR